MLSYKSKPGKVKKIQLQNFLIHCNTTVQFGLNCTVILGTNGSGKSAIASSLAVCLGSRGTKSGRETKSLKEFIRVPLEEEEQCHAAIVTVTFDNSGDSPYMSDKYGQEIVIERRITSAGTSSYKVSNKSGRLCSTDKKNVDEIREGLKINMDNVITYLNQDNAKKFLRSHTPADFYKFFEKSLNMEEIEEQLQKSSVSITTSERSFTSVSADLQKETEKFENHQKTVEELRSRKRLRNEIKKFNSWLVRLREEKALKELQDLRGSQAEHQQNITAHRQQIEQFQVEISELEKSGEERKKQVEEQIECSTTKRRSIEKLIDGELIPKLSTLRIKLSELKKNEFELKQKIQVVENEQNEIERELNVDLNPIKNKRLKCEAVLNRLNTEIAGLQVEANESEDYTVDYSSERERLNDDYAKEKEKLISIKESLQSVESQKSSVSTSQIFRERFGYDLQWVVDEINRDSRFSAKPIGPVSNFVYSTERLWNDKARLEAVEVYLNRFLCHWLVVNISDYRLLEDKLRNSGCRNPQIVTLNSQAFHRPKPFDPSMFRRSDGVDYLIDLLDITNVNIKNYLIDKAFVESCALFDSFSQMVAATKNRQVRLLRALESEGCRHAIRYGGGAGVEVPPLTRVNIQQSIIRLRCGIISEQELQRERQNSIDHLNTIFKTQQNTIREIIIKMNELSNREKQTKQAAENKRSALDLKLKEMRRTEIQLEDFDVQIKTAEAKFERLKSGYDVKVNHIKEQMMIFNSDVHEVEVKIKSTQEEIPKAEDQINKTKKIIKEINIDIENAQRSLRTHEQQPHQVREIRLLEKQIQTEECRLKTIETELSEKQQEYEKMKNRATGIKEEFDHENFRLDYSIEEVENQLAQVSKQLRHFQARHAATEEEEEEEEAREQARVLKTIESKLNLHKQTENELKLIIQKDKQIHADLQRLKNKLTSDAGNNIKESFERNMERISPLRASIDFNHESKQIRFYTGNSSSNTPTDLNTLSGGERASMQSGLIMAFAESSESPIHIFDEFDVFMDDETRYQVLKLLFEFVKRHKDRQFIFCTPHNEVESFFQNEKRINNDENFQLNILTLKKPGTSNKNQHLFMSA